MNAYVRIISNGKEMLAYRRMLVNFTNVDDATNLNCLSSQMIYCDLDPQEMGWLTASPFVVAFATHNFRISSIAPLKASASEGLALLAVEASR